MIPGPSAAELEASAQAEEARLFGAPAVTAYELPQVSTDFEVMLTEAEETAGIAD
mgnify:CR=1 FL=1